MIQKRLELSPIKGESQTRLGSKIITVGYELNYTYKVNDLVFNNTDLIQYKAGNAEFIQFAMDNMNKNIFTVKYVSWQPDKSFVVKRLN